MITLYAVSNTTAYKVRAEIVGCESCSPDAEIPLPWVLDKVAGLDGAETDYVLPEPLKCPKCFAEIGEESLVEWEQ